MRRVPSVLAQGLEISRWEIRNIHGLLHMFDLCKSVTPAQFFILFVPGETKCQ